MQVNLQKRLLAGHQSFDLAFNAEIQAGELVALFGESGAGKTSILRLLAGLMKADNGLIQFGDKIWFDSRSNHFLTPQKRDVGMVFQDTALFPNMTVFENLSYAKTKNTGKEHIDELIQLTDLSALLDRKPDRLSGGEKQRVALARSLVPKPQLLLLDEPLSALDFYMRKHLQDQIQKLHNRFNLTTLLVSHDVGEIYRLADRILVLKDGKIAMEGDPLQVFGDKKLSGKFQFTGQILEIEKQDVVYIVSILINNQVVQVVADISEASELSQGDQVLVASKAFNPIIQRIGR